MAINLVELRIAKEVASSTEDCVTHIPPSGAYVLISDFVGDAAFQPNAAVKLVWDVGGAGETVLWSIKGNHEMPGDIEILDSDGVKKLGVCLDNGEAGPLFLSGYAKVEVTT